MSELALPTGKHLRDLKDVPALRQVAVLLALALAVAAGFAIFNWSQTPNFQPVYPGLSAKDSGDITQALRTAGISVHLDPNTGEVDVPAEKLYQARTLLAAQGLPKNPATGFEMIEQDQGIGTSQFIENARYQMALETELARTISSLQPVKTARVHLALPKASPFVVHQEAASASVLVELYPGRELERGQVNSIVHIVSSSVPNMLPAAVSVIDQYGRLLTQNDVDPETQRSAQQFDQTHRTEADYARRIDQILSPMLGQDHFSTQVAADLDFDITEQATEAYKPDPAAIRSEQSSEDTRRGPGVPSGVPGALSNQPPNANLPAQQAAALQAQQAQQANGAATAGTATPPTGQTSTSSTGDGTLSQSRTDTRNYELNRTISHTREQVGRVRRLSVAVLVDNVTVTDTTGKTSTVARTPEDLAKIEALVKEAVGFDANRGDTVTVQNAPFAPTDVNGPPPLPIWQQPMLHDMARPLAGALLVLTLILVVLRPLLKYVLGEPGKVIEGEIAGAEAVEGHDGETAGELGDDHLSLSGDGEDGVEGGAGDRTIEHKPSEADLHLADARNAVAQDPKRVAQVIKTWLGETGG